MITAVEIQYNFGEEYQVTFINFCYFKDHKVENPNLVILKEKDQVYIAISTLWICHGGKYATKFWLNKLNSG